jgi:predicted amidophosphoribosyltransferase
VCGFRGSSPCPGCLERLRPAPGLRPPPGLTSLVALLAYEGAGRELVARLKYRNHRAALGGLARAGASLVSPVPDVVTWAPTSTARRQARGYDQAELLARGVGRALDRPVRRLLRRGAGGAQTGRTRLERLEGPSFLPAWGATAARLAGRRVLVVDDVVTTGATMSAAATTLRTLGAELHGLAIARTAPGPRP